jgi:hypothetical protein
MRVAGLMIKDAPMQFDASSLQEIDHSRNGQFSAIELTDDYCGNRIQRNFAK